MKKVTLTLLFLWLLVFDEILQKKVIKEKKKKIKKNKRNKNLINSVIVCFNFFARIRSLDLKISIPNVSFFVYFCRHHCWSTTNIKPARTSLEGTHVAWKTRGSHWWERKRRMGRKGEDKSITEYSVTSMPSALERDETSVGYMLVQKRRCILTGLSPLSYRTVRKAF